MDQRNAGWRFRQLVDTETPLKVVGVINTLCALLAKQAGLSALYLSGAGVSNACFGLPDLGLTSLTDVTEEVRRITQTVDLPLLVDADTGWGSILNVSHTIQSLEKAGAAACHLEDQTWPKRCGHRDGKQLVSTSTMVDTIKAAVDGRRQSDFVVMARTDAVAVEGLDAAIERAQTYAEAGADMIFAEAVTQLEDYQQFVNAVKVPVLANITEFGKTPLFTAKQLHSVGVKLMLYPLSAFRAMNQAALEVFQIIEQEGSQSKCLTQMQTREELYQLLDYHKFEEKLG